MYTVHAVNVEVLHYASLFTGFIMRSEADPQLQIANKKNNFRIVRSSIRRSPIISEYNNISDVYRVIIRFLNENYNHCRISPATFEIKHKDNYYIVSVESL